MAIRAKAGQRSRRSGLFAKSPFFSDGSALLAYVCRWILLPPSYRMGRTVLSYSGMREVHDRFRWIRGTEDAVTGHEHIGSSGYQLLRVPGSHAAIDLDQCLGTGFRT